MTHTSENTTQSGQNRSGRQALDHDSSREQAIEHIHAHAKRIEQQELETAITKLENQGDFTEIQREIIADMANTLVAELVAPPTQSLRNACSSDQSDIQVALELFDPDSLSNGEQR